MRIDLKYCTVTLKDGSTTPKTLVIKVGDGTLTFDEKRTRHYERDRGLLDTVRDGDQEPVDLKIDMVWEFLKAIATGTPPPQPYEALKKTGAAAAWVSSDSDLCAPYAVDVEVVYTPPCTGTPTETYLFSDFRYESIAGDPKAGTLNVTGKANVTAPTVTRT